MFWKKLFKQNDIQIDILKEWQAHDNFYADGVLVRVQNGKGILREVYSSYEGNQIWSLAMQDRPLIQFQGDEYFCPTCEKIVRSGYGMDQSFHLEMPDINKSKQEVLLIDAVRNLFPLLGLLKSGYYAILDTCLHPTDGNGHLFWESPYQGVSKGACMYYYGDGEWGNLRPYFTIASEPIHKCNKERINYYRENPGCRGIAYYMEGYLTTLLDGHHKALAAAIDGKDVNALVIMQGTLWYRSLHNGQNENFTIGCRMGDMNFTSVDLQMTKREKQELSAKFNGGCREITEANQLQQELMLVHSDESFPVDIKGLADAYPMVEEQAEIDRVGEINDQRIDDIKNGIIFCDESDICHLMSALSGLKLPRGIEMGRFFMSHNHNGYVYEHILRCIMRYPRTEELEQYFIDEMVRLEDYHSNIKRLVLEYL
ncbi:hypothetical protein [Lacrimispora xylanolytica]|uniref:Uncharacterized protein n=1 Tax=Lacrimispora xylanolytica TaxID=29375 RepID=A0ABY7A769_9FIRM|nr:hypothetical protein [Lacrimispora xylanolytica]WAJ22337.1 hypothetical protein OW255_12200 [Lacrimispora xylanolytica]